VTATGRRISKRRSLSAVSSRNTGRKRAGWGRSPGRTRCTRRARLRQSPPAKPCHFMCMSYVPPRVYVIGNRRRSYMAMSMRVGRPQTPRGDACNTDDASGRGTAYTARRRLQQRQQRGAGHLGVEVREDHKLLLERLVHALRGEPLEDAERRAEHEGLALEQVVVPDARRDVDRERPARERGSECTVGTRVGATVGRGGGGGIGQRRN
jgi:hypothetical protein